MNRPLDIVGTWKLLSFEIEQNDGTRKNWGTNTHGLLFYSDDGYMSVSINKDVVRESENEIEDLFDSILFYAGTYRIEGTTIHHKVTEASNPSRIGKDMIRYCESSGDTITLTTPKEDFGRAILVWKRI